MAIKNLVANFVAAQNAAVVIDPATANEKIVRGLQGMGLCLGFEMETQVVAEMGRRIALVIPSGGQYEATTINYNFVPGDPTFDRLRNAALNSTNLQVIRLYVKRGCDFSAPDFISDPASGLYVGTVNDPKVDNPNGIFTGTLSYMPGGAFVLYIAHTTSGGGTTLSYTAATRTLTDTANLFVTNGFEVGDSCLLDWADGHAPLALQIESVTAGAVVFTADVGDVAMLTSDFTGIATTQLHGATPLVVTGYAGIADCS